MILGSTPRLATTFDCTSNSDDLIEIPEILEVEDTECGIEDILGRLHTDPEINEKGDDDDGYWISN